jgi:hypothetical protein
MKPHLNLMLCIALFLPAGMAYSDGHNKDTSNSCEGIAPLYTPEAHDDAPTHPLGFLQILRDTPIAFAPSGNQCLGPIPIYKTSILHWETPERDTHAMARKLAPLLKQYSKETGLEACARMCKTPTGEIVTRVVTLRAHVVCMAPESTCPEGSVATKEIIHSHPPHPAFVANAVDALGWDDLSIENMARFTGYPNSLSPQDRKMAPVWLVGTEGQLVYLDTPDGTEVERPP